MREINPRAWSIYGECWCTRVDYDGYKKEWSGIVPVLAPDNRSKCIGEIVDTNIIVEFPTGLKDKNGKEIHEGDIVRLKHLYHFLLCGTGESKEYTERVYWGKKDASFVVGDWFEPLGHLVEEDDIEVIGNIHENTELLEAKNVD